MMSLELAPGVTPEDVGYPTVTASIERVDRWTVHLVPDGHADACTMLTREQGATGRTALVGWRHHGACPVATGLTSGVGNGRCNGGTP